MDPKTVYYARNPIEAKMVQSFLTEAGIESVILGGGEQAGLFDMGDVEPVIMVAPDDVERAEAAIAQFREESQTENNLADVSDAEGQFNWPICPQCDELRDATCNQCQTTSTEFSADLAGEDLHVVCLACHEQVAVTFADRCRYCMHDFAAAESMDPESPGSDFEPAVSNGRAVLLVAAIGLLILVMAIWFALSTTS